MATTFKVSTDELLRASNSFNNRRTTVLNLIRELINIGGSLRGSWQGQAATTYYNKLCQIQGDLNDVNKIINEHVQDLMEIARQYATTEGNVTQAAQQLNPDVISY